MADLQEIHPELRALREDVAEIKGFMAKMSEAIERLARLEERHGNTTAALERAFGAISKLNDRVTLLEKAQPVQNLTSDWVVRAVWAVAGMALMVLARKAGVM